MKTETLILQDHNFQEKRNIRESWTKDSGSRNSQRHLPDSSHMVFQELIAELDGFHAQAFTEMRWVIRTEASRTEFPASK